MQREVEEIANADLLQFPNKILYLHMRTQNGMSRTNNNIQGLHYAFSVVSNHHPNIWKFIEVFKREVSSAIKEAK